MKLLTFTVPCFNSAAYMEKCIESLLPGGEDVEILIVDDGSTDDTAAIADRYEKQYPTIVKAIHKENGGHGSAVNAGIEHASGLYFKVVDSDDWVKQEAYEQILSGRTKTGCEKLFQRSRIYSDVILQKEKQGLIRPEDAFYERMKMTCEEAGFSISREECDAFEREYRYYQSRIKLYDFM